MCRIVTIFLCCSFLLLTPVSGQLFREVSTSAGISGTAVDPKLMAGGAVWFDYDKDRYPDLLLTNGMRTTRLYRNNWDGTFTDISELAGLLNVSQTMGAVSGDFDGDGFPDLFITTLPELPNRLLRNNGSGRFVDVSRSAGIVENSYGASATVGDYDGDGDLDIYVANYLAGTEIEEGGQPNFFYRNEGDFTFTEVAAVERTDDVGCGLGATFTDLNGDGRMDLYVANDFGNQVEPNEYFQYSDTGFVRRAERTGTAATINGMGIAKGDYDRDGDLDLYVTNIRENPLFENTLGGDFFNFASFTAGVALSELTSWGTSFTDFDLDGWLDLVVANGEIAEIVNEGEAQRYYRNNADGTFSDESIASGLDEIVSMGRGLAVADYDLDGYPDVAIHTVQLDQSGEEQVSLLHNEGNTGGQWLAVETPLNAVKLSLYAGEEHWMREVDGGSSYLSHSAGPVHFGAPGLSGSIDSLVVTFTNAPPLTFTELSWNALIGIRADGSWYLINHNSRSGCGSEPALPVVTAAYQTDAQNREVLLLERTTVDLFPVLEEEIVELTAGEVFRGVARTQDAVLVDTIATQGPCPALQPIRLNVLPVTDEPAVYPNPLIGDQLDVLLPAPGGLIHFSLWTSTGRLISRQRRQLAPQQRTLTISVPGLSAGAYLLQLEVAGKATYHKIIRP